MIRLIVADDAPFIREIVRQIAQTNAMEVVGEALDGNEAVEMALRLNPDVVLMDIVMPGRSGIEAAREILSKAPHARIVAFSTVDQETMVMKALEAGCCNFLVKPFKAEQLLRVIRGAMLEA